MQPIVSIAIFNCCPPNCLHLLTEYNLSGGMGLTGGLVDAGNLFDCLYGIATGQADDSILDKYSEVRIQKYQDIINPISSDNIKRLWDPSPEAIQKDPFFQAVERAKTDKEFEQRMKKVWDLREEKPTN